MDFSFTEEQRMMRESVRKLMEMLGAQLRRSQASRAAAGG